MKDAQESTLESKIFKIPIEEYEENMKIGPGKEKKNDILYLLTSYNKLRSKDEYKEIKSRLHIACQRGDFELIKI